MTEHRVNPLQWLSTKFASINHSHNEYVNPTIVDDLTSDDNTKVLSAKQGKVLKTSLDGKANSSHNHDDRYYTETETDNLLNEKSNTNHTHSQYLTQHQSLANYIQKSSTNGLLKNDGSIDTTQYLSSLPSHNHDDRYYTESEVNTALDGKANSTHNHTKSQITDFPTSMPPTSHTHGNLQNDGSVGTSNNASKNVVTDSNGKITTEAKPTIPTATSDLTNDSNFITSSSLNDYVNKTDISLDSDFLETFLQSLIDYGIENDKEWINL